MLSLSYNFIAIETLIGYSCIQLAVKSKPIRLNVYLESNNISKIIIKLKAI